jgi:hypothetical protein
MDAYAHTLANYCNLVGVEDSETLLFFIKNGANIDPELFKAVAQQNEADGV